MAKSSIEINVVPVVGKVAITRMTAETGAMLCEILKAADIPKGNYTYFVDGAPAHGESRIGHKGSTAGSPIVIKAYELST
jgi:hypothetical protein